MPLYENRQLEKETKPQQNCCTEKSLEQKNSEVKVEKKMLTEHNSG